MKRVRIFAALRRHLWGILLALITVFALIKFSSLPIKTKVVSVSQSVISSSAIPKTFNPALIQEAAYILDYTHEALISENYQGEIEPALAESWKISEDKKRINLSLRKGLKWSDGQPITTDDVVFTYNEIFLGKDIPNNAKDLFRVGKNSVFPTVRKIDRLRFEFIIPQPFVPFLRLAKLPILPVHALREAVNTKDQEGKPKFLST